MGMFDWIEYKHDCECGEPLEGFQSKDGDCVLATLQPSDVEGFYTACDDCGKWHDFKYIPAKEGHVICITTEDEEE
jgi:hypothetical protein